MQTFILLIFITDLEIQFLADSFASLESQLFIPVSVVLDKVIATPITISVSPKTLQEHRLSGRRDPLGTQPDNDLSPFEASMSLTHFYD